MNTVHINNIQLMGCNTIPTYSKRILNSRYLYSYAVMHVLITNLLLNFLVALNLKHHREAYEAPSSQQ